MKHAIENAKKAKRGGCETEALKKKLKEGQNTLGERKKNGERKREQESKTKMERV